MARTGQDLIQDLRVDLNEFVEGNWSDSTLLRYLERAAHKVATVMRFSRQGYLEQVIDNTTADFTVYGATYSPATSLTKVAGNKTITLPENCVELRAVLPVSQDQRDNGVAFVLTTVDSPEYRNARRIQQTSVNRTYWCVLTNLTTLRIAPPLAEAINFEIQYVAMPQRLTLDTPVDGIPEVAYEAMLAYAQYLALKAIKHEDWVTSYEGWKTEKREAIEALAQRTSDEPDIVAGVFDEVDFWEGLFFEYNY